MINQIEDNQICTVYIFKTNLIFIILISKILKEQIPFQKYFQVEPIKAYTKVILMDDFMKHIADKVWPKGKRIGNLFSTHLFIF